MSNAQFDALLATINGTGGWLLLAVAPSPVFYLVATLMFVVSILYWIASIIEHRAA